MTGKEKIAELEQAIKETREELAAAREEKKEAAGDPERLVTAEKKERRISGQLKALEQAKTAATYTPPEPTDRAELLAGFQKYRDAKAEKVQKVRVAITDAERQLRATKSGLEQAAEECDTERTLELSEKKSDLERKLKHLYEMRERVEALHTFPEEAFGKEWDEICRKTLPEWHRRALRVETLAEQYRAACADLLGMHDTLKGVRDEVARMVNAEGYAPLYFPPVFTADIDGDRLTVQKGDYVRLATIAHPISGRPL